MGLFWNIAGKLFPPFKHRRYKQALSKQNGRWIAVVITAILQLYIFMTSPFWALLAFILDIVFVYIVTRKLRAGTYVFDTKQILVLLLPTIILFILCAMPEAMRNMDVGHNYIENRHNYPQ